MTRTLTESDSVVYYDVVKTVRVDEDDVLDMHLDDMLYTMDDLYSECERIACTQAYSELATLVNVKMGSHTGFNWSRLTAHRANKDVYRVSTRIECHTDIGESVSQLVNYVEASLEQYFGADEHTTFAPVLAAA